MAEAGTCKAYGFQDQTQDGSEQRGAHVSPNPTTPPPPPPSHLIANSRGFLAGVEEGVSMPTVLSKTLIAGYRGLASTLDSILSGLEAEIHPGVTTRQLEDRAVQLMQEHKVWSYFKGYNGYPASITTSVNQEIINTIPSEKILRTGDLLSIQVGITDGKVFSYQGWTYPIGPIGERERNLMQTAQNALHQACALCTAEHTIQDVSRAIQTTIETAGFSVNRDYIGHGMGMTPHKDPQVPGYIPPRKQRLKQLVSGQILSIVVLTHAGKRECHITSDGWNVVTQDGSPAAHFSNIVLVGENASELLTRARGPSTTAVTGSIPP